MSNFRRGLMSIQSSSDYIQDGLVFYLDCERECGSNVWKDVIGGFVLNSNTEFELVKGVPHFNGGVYYSDSYTDLFERKKCTIECSFKQENTTPSFLFKSNMQRSIGMIQYNNVMENGYNPGVGYGNVACFPYTRDKFFKSISIVGDDGMYVNKGEKVSKTSIDNWGISGEKTILGGRSSSSSLFKGYIFSLRIYNRLLTEKEIFFNQGIDIKRFSNF